MMLTTADKAALRAYREYAGRSWKRKLRDDWAAGRTQNELAALRNRADFGPAGLAKLKPSDLDWAMGATCEFGEHAYHVISDATVALYNLDIALSNGYTGNREHPHDKAIQTLRGIIRPFLEASSTPNILPAIKAL